MGLDMYIYEIQEGNPPPDILNLPEDRLRDRDEEKMVEFFFWRKHPDLHGWFQQLHELRGGENCDPESFNGVLVKLNRNDIINLEDVVLTKQLPKTTGFFFGNS